MLPKDGGEVGLGHVVGKGAVAEDDGGCLLPPYSGGFSRRKSASFSRSSRYRRRSSAFFTTGPVWGWAADQARNCSQNTWISLPASAARRSLTAHISSKRGFVIMAIPQPLEKARRSNSGRSSPAAEEWVRPAPEAAPRPAVSFQSAVAPVRGGGAACRRGFGLARALP